MNRKPPREISADDIRAYQEDGVVCLRGMFDADWVERMTGAVERSMACPSKWSQEMTRPGGPGRFHMNIFMARRDDDFRALALESPAAEIAGRLMGARRVSFFYDQLFVKDPGTTEPTYWHHDLTYWPVDGEQIASVWIALTPVDRSSSGVEYAAGSHRWGKRYRARTPDDDPRFVDLSLEQCPDLGERRDDPALRLLSWEMEPGDVLCHHPLTVHGAGGNGSATRRRIGVSLRYAGEDAVWAPRPATLPIPGKPQDSLKPGDRLVLEGVFPIAWEPDITKDADPPSARPCGPRR